MVWSLTGAFKTLAWAVVSTGLVLIVCGVFFADGAVAYCTQHDAFTDDSTEELRKHFGSLWLSMLSLLMAMSGGEDWGQVKTALSPLSWEYTLFFLAFIFF